MSRLLDKNIALLWCCQCVTTLGLMAMVPIMPLYLERLGSGYSPVWASFALAAPAVTALMLSPWIGKACDRYGYRLLVLSSLLGFSLSMALMAFSSGIGGFLLGRLLLGASGVSVTLTAFACAACRAERRGRVLGLLQSASACGCLAGPVIGGILMDIWSLRPLLVATAIFSGLAALLAAQGLQAPANTDTKKNISEAAPGGRLSVLRHPLLRNWMLAACLSQAAAFALVNVFVLFLSTRLPGTALASATGLIHAAAWGTGMLFSPWWGRANDSGDVRRHFGVAALGCALSIGLLPFTDRLWQVVLLRVVQGGCFTALAQSVFFSLSQIQSPEKQGESAGVVKSYLVSGQMIGPLLVAALLPWWEPVTILWWVSVLFIAAAFFAWRTPKIHATEAGTINFDVVKT